MTARVPRIHTALALGLHAYGLRQLLDPNWTGMELFDRLKQHVRGRVEPVGMLRKTIQDGLMYHLGLWLYEEYVLDVEGMPEEECLHILSLEDEHRAWYLEDIVGALLALGARKTQKSIARAQGMLDTVEALFQEDEEKYFQYLCSQQATDDFKKVYSALLDNNRDCLVGAMPAYAANYADRVFHDRQLCEHISRTVVIIGFDGASDEHGEPTPWVARQTVPDWAKRAVRARDRGKCTRCGVDIVGELSGVENIDHIVPLAQGGSNDLVNLQLLCGACNNEKAARTVDVTSSIPEYISRRRLLRGAGA
jgi:hypothetical protein